MILARRRNASAFTRLLALVVAVALPASLSITAQAADAQTLAAGLLPAAALPAANAATDEATLRLAVAITPETLADDDTTFSDEAPTRAAVLDPSMVCLAKAVHHEARNQPRAGQLAVAQLVMARLADGRFGDSVCAVINQRGQFFDTSGYSPDRGEATWAVAVAVAREAMEGASSAVAPGALFFHAAYQAPSSFFRSRQRVATLGDHIFYR